MIFRIDKIDGTSTTGSSELLAYVECSGHELTVKGFEYSEQRRDYKKTVGWNCLVATEVATRSLDEIEE